VWFVSSCLVATGLFWAFYNGFIALMIAADATGLCLGITFLTPLILAYIGRIAYKLQFNKFDSMRSSYLAVELALPNEFKNITILVGVFGTAIGLLYMLFTLSSLLSGASAGSDLLPVIAKITEGMGTALWVTVVSLASACIVWIQTFTIELSFEKIKILLDRGE
jgi:hypothetical protein